MKKFFVTMKKLLRKIWTAVQKAYAKMVSETREMVPIAVGAVEAIKNVMDGPVDDILAEIIKAAIPGNADNILIDRARAVLAEYIPKVLFELKLIDSIANIDDPNEQLKAILLQLKLSSNETKAVVYHGLATLILEKLSDGKLSFSDSAAIAEYYYQHVVKTSK